MLNGLGIIEKLANRESRGYARALYWLVFCYSAPTVGILRRAAAS